VAYLRFGKGGGHSERVERKPITGILGRSPQRSPGEEPLVGGGGQKDEASLKLKRLAAGFQKRSATPASYQMQSYMAILIPYCIGMKEDHQTLLDFAILAGKWQKAHLFI